MKSSERMCHRSLPGYTWQFLPKGEAANSASDLFLPRGAAVGGQDVHRLRAKFQQKSGQAQRQVGIAVDRKLLAMDMRAGIGDGIDQPAALLA